MVVREKSVVVIPRFFLLVFSLMILNSYFVASDVGGVITNVGGYTIHTFNVTGNFTFNVTANKNIELLIVGGGGAGGHSATGNAGGGGAGGLVYNVSYPVVVGSYNVSVGSGGIYIANSRGGNGTNSSFGTIIAVGGGGGGTLGTSGNPGGSGGGSGQQGLIGGTGIAGQGFNGGNNLSNGFGGAGGGGANQSGRNTSINNFGEGGFGGNGTNYSISGVSICYAGGGGGSTHSSNTTSTGSLGGCGGGGKGSAVTQGVLGANGTNGLGGGGGGNGENGGASGYGGSGIVIVRYLTPVVLQVNISPSNGSSFFVGNHNYFDANVSSSGFGGNVSTTAFVYNSTNDLIYTYFGQSNPFLFNVTNLSIGTYKINATANNYSNYIIYNFANNSNHLMSFMKPVYYNNSFIFNGIANNTISPRFGQLLFGAVPNFTNVNFSMCIVASVNGNNSMTSSGSGAENISILIGTYNGAPQVDIEYNYQSGARRFQAMVRNSTTQTLLQTNNTFVNLGETYNLCLYQYSNTSSSSGWTSQFKINDNLIGSANSSGGKLDTFNFSIGGSAITNSNTIRLLNGTVYYANVTINNSIWGIWKFNNVTGLGGFENSSVTNNINIYNLTNQVLTTPSSLATRKINITWNNITINPTNTPINLMNYNISLYNENDTLIRYINITAYNNRFEYNWYNENKTAGNYRLNLTITDSNQITTNYQKNISFNTDMILNLSLFTEVNNTPINGNNLITLTNLENGNITTINGSSSTIIDLKKANNYYIVIIPTQGYAITNATYLTNNTLTSQSLNITLFTSNSINITILNQDTGNRIYDNISVTFTGVGVQTYYTNTSQLYVDNLANGAWNLRFTGNGYGITDYTITVNNQSHQTLNAYLVSGNYTTIFTVLNNDNTPLENANIGVERQFNASYVNIQTLTTDITGKATLYYTPNAPYRFTVTKNGYQSRTFNLSSILYTDYTIYLSNQLTGNYGNPFTDVIVSINPSVVNNNALANISVNINSPVGSLLNYSYQIIYTPVGVVGYYNASNSYGDTSLRVVNISGATYSDQLYIDLTYTSTLSGTINNRYPLTILNVATGSYTITKLKSNDYGLGWFEKIGISTLILVVVVGYSFVLAGIGGSLVIGMLTEGVLVYLGMMPLYGALISMFVGFILLIRFGGN